MTTSTLRPMTPALALAALLAIAPAADAQIAGGADRYVGTTQGSLNRTNAAIGSIGSTSRIGGMGANAYGNSAMQSVNRTNAMVQTMLANQEAAMRGRQQQVIHRTPDNLHGVYWQNYYANRARLFATQSRAMPYGNPYAMPFGFDPGPTRATQLQLSDNQRRRAQERERSRELSHRFQQRSNPDPPGTPAPQFDTIQRGMGNLRLEDLPTTATNPRTMTTVAPTPTPTIIAPTPIPTGGN
jgi:hypothetical protein